MVLDLSLGLAALAIGTALMLCSAPLARLMREGDERWRENHPWTQAYEPQTTLFATDDGRFALLRGWLLVSAAGFLAVGTALVTRAT